MQTKALLASVLIFFFFQIKAATNRNKIYLKPAFGQTASELPPVALHSRYYYKNKCG